MKKSELFFWTTCSLACSCSYKKKKKPKCLSNKMLRIMSPGKFTQGHSFMSIKKKSCKAKERVI